MAHCTPPVPPAAPPPVVNDPYPLLQLTPEQVRALPPDLREEWRRQSQAREDDFDLLVRFVDELRPLCRKYARAARAQEDGDYRKDAQGRWDRLIDHLLSLPACRADDPGWLARVAYHHAAFKARRAEKAARKAQGG